MGASTLQHFHKAYWIRAAVAQLFWVFLPNSIVPNTVWLTLSPAAFSQKLDSGPQKALGCSSETGLVETARSLP